MSKLDEIREAIDYLQNGAGRSIGHEPSVDDVLDLLRRLCDELERVDKASNFKEA